MWRGTETVEQGVVVTVVLTDNATEYFANDIKHTVVITCLCAINSSH